MKNPGGYIGEALADIIARDNRRKNKRRRETSEAAVKKAIAKYLTATGVRHFRMQSGAMMGSYKGKPWRMNLCPPGTPDFLVLKQPELWTAHEYRPTFILWLEVKRPLGPKGGTGGSEQNPDQVEFERVAKAHGERYAVVRSVDDVIAALDNPRVEIRVTGGEG